MSQSKINSFFKPTNSVNPDQIPTVSKQVILECNAAISNEITKPSKKRGSYAHYTNEFKFEVGKFAAENGDSKAVQKYSIKDKKAINESTIRSWKLQYLEQLANDKKSNSIVGVKRGRPNLLRSDIEEIIKTYLKQLRENGGIVNSRIIKAVSIAVTRKIAPQILVENGGYLELSRRWAYNFAVRNGYVNRKGTKSTKANVPQKNEVCDKFRSECLKIIKEHSIPDDLIINWDETGVQLLPTANYTMEHAGIYTLIN